MLVVSFRVIHRSSIYFSFNSFNFFFDCIGMTKKIFICKLDGALTKCDFMYAND